MAAYIDGIKVITSASHSGSLELAIENWSVYEASKLITKQTGRSPNPKAWNYHIPLRNFGLIRTKTKTRLIGFRVLIKK